MSSNSLIFKNTIFLITRTIIISLVGLFTVRELLSILGAQSYGLFSLVFGIALLFSFINEAMVSSTQRYLSYYIGIKDIVLLREVWKSSIFLHFIIGLAIVFLLLMFKSLMIFTILKIDQELISSAVFIYYGAVFTIFILVIQAPFSALVLANEDMSFYAWVSLVNAIMKLAIIYLLYLTDTSKLETYTVLYFISALLIFSIYATYCYRKYGFIFNKTSLKISLTKEIFFYSGWNIYGNFANVSRTQGINVILNVFFGTIINATYAVANNVSNVVSGLINSVLTSIKPQIYKSYAQKDTKRNTELITYGSKYSYYFALILISPIILNAGFLVELWLETPPDYSVIFIKLGLITILINCLSGPLMAGIQATGKIKAYQVIVGFVVFANLPISYILLRVYEYPYVPYVVAIVLAIIALYLRLLFLEKLIFYKISGYIKEVMAPIIYVTIITIFSFSILYNTSIHEKPFIEFIIESFLITLANLLAIYLIGLKTFERKFIYKIVSGKLK